MIPASLVALGSLPIKMLPAESWVLPQKAKANESIPKKPQPLGLDFLNNTVILRIAGFLSLNDLRSLSCSCKKLAAKRIASAKRNITLAAKILNNTPFEADFDVIASYNVDKIENARFIFLGESHIKKNCKRTNAHLVSFLAAKMPIAIFVEGSPSMKLVQNPAGIKKKYMLEDIPGSVQFYGWDKDLRKFTEQKCPDIWTLEMDGPKESCKDRIELLNHSIHQCLFTLQSIASNNSELIPGYSTNELFKSSHSQTQAKPLYLLENASKLATFYQRLITQVDSSPFSPDILSDLKKKVSGMHFVQLLQNVTSLVDERRREIVETAFPERVQENIITVQKVDQLQKEGKLPLTAVFIEGVGHLKETRRNTKRPELFSLKNFYQEICKQKAIVLCPKSLGVFDL